LNAPRDDTFLASLLYYLGVLTLAGRDEQGRLRLTIPNLVVRSLYAERLYDALLPEYEDRETRRAAADRFYAYADPEPLCDFIEQRFFKVFDNRNLRWSNELTVKTAFLTCWVPYDYIGPKIESLLRAREVMELLVSTSAPEEAQ